MSIRTGSGVLLVLLWCCAVTGLLSLFENARLGSILMLAHRATGIALLLLIPWKARVAFRSVRRRARRGVGARRGLDLSSLVSGLAAGAFLASLSLGLAWALALVPDWILGFGPLLLHWWLGAAILPLLLWHMLARWPRPSRYDFQGRRRLLAGLGGSLLALAGGLALERLAAIAHPRGHRWTGSRHAGSFTGNAMPTTIFLNDSVQHLDPSDWALAVRGAVARPLHLSLPDLLELGRSSNVATLDCTSGWYSTQEWAGVSLPDILAAAGARPDCPVLVRSATGYFTLLTPGELAGCLLATRIGHEPLSPSHGAPARLVAPARRGWQWIKWVTEIEVLAVT